MRRKNKYFYFFLLVIIFFISFQNIYKKKCKGTYLKSIDTSKFNKKLKNPPFWLNDQIQNDFSSFNEVTNECLNKTYEKIKNNESIFINNFFRYRVIDNKLYRLYAKNEKISNRKLDFEKAILTLAKLAKIPDIDFIYCDLDGLPQLDGGKTTQNVEESFYLIDNKKLQAPIFCHAKRKENKYLVLIPDHNSYTGNYFFLCKKIIKENQKSKWQEKLEVAFFRGGSNDKEYDLENYKKKPRFVISKLSQEHSHIIDAGITKSWFFKLEDILKKENVIKDYATESFHLNYKYLPVIDGHMCTYPGYQWRLLSNSVALKQDSDEIQWFYSALKPYEHYVPIKNDMSDLVNKINWAKKNDETCRKISENATDFVLNNLLIEDVYLYLYKVLQAYSKKFQIEKSFLVENTKNNSGWDLIEQKQKGK